MHIVRRFYIPIVSFGLLILILLVVRIERASTTQPDHAALAGPADADEVYVPAGEFLMGCAADIWTYCDNDSKPIHAVYLDAFFIDKTEVTVAEYQACMAAGVCPPPGELDETASQTARQAVQDAAFQVGAANAGDLPITYMTWEHADTYCRWVGKRLPTEAEWEKAAHGPGWQIYPWGNEPPTCERLNFNQCNNGVVAVGSYPQNASPYGALDMSGNVREWINDWYDTDYYGRSNYYNPQGPKKEETKGEHLLRGGAWKDQARAVTAWIRLDEAETYYIYKAGIRCVRTAPPNANPTPTRPPPTPTPNAARNLTTTGGALWFDRSQDHLTLVEVPAGALSSTTVVTVSYDTASPPRPLSSINHAFRLHTGNGQVTLNAPVTLIVAFPQRVAVEAGTLHLYRLHQGSWITAGITTTLSGSNYLHAEVSRTGVYALLGRAHHLYMPITLR